MSPATMPYRDGRVKVDYRREATCEGYRHTIVIPGKRIKVCGESVEQAMSAAVAALDASQTQMSRMSV